MGIKTAYDLLYYFPRDWRDLTNIKPISEIKPNETVNIKAIIKKVGGRYTRFRRMYLTEALLSDNSSNVIAVWFNQPFLKNILREGKEYYFSGKTQIYQPRGQTGQTLQLSNPTFELVKTDTIHTAGIIPVYTTPEEITQKQFRYWLKQALAILPGIPEYLPSALRIKLQLLELKDALKNIHFPESQKALEAARERLAFDELFLFQLALQSFKKKLKTFPATPISFDTKSVKSFVSSLPFKLTNSQRLAAWEILQDLSEPHPMNRLLEGEVGSGKTVVAGLAMLQVARAGWQSVLLAPTEILAWQHYQTLVNLLQNAGLPIALSTRSRKIGTLEEIATGQTKIIIGTHALLQEKVQFAKIGLLVVDEQHRFGVKQRARLADRGQYADNTRTNAEDKLLYEDLSYKIRKALFEIRKELGLGHKEIIYQNSLAEKFKNMNVNFDREKQIVITYNDKRMGTYQPDFIVEDKIILELKALPFIGNIEKRQIWNYLKGSTYKLALLVNFSSTDVEIKRIVYDIAREFPRKSASSQRESALIPHLLSMTATPIPRTLALAFYGDLDISQLRELPIGRKKVITRLVEPEKRSLAYEFVRKQLQAGRQAYVVTPLIEESDKLGIKAAGLEAEKLKKEIFPEFEIGLLHGRMKGEEKKKVMEEFQAGKLPILVTTTVIEVGVDMPNATIILIENAERFGLAQLHQLRGRVGRSTHQSYCLLFAENSNQYTKERLEAVVKSNDGFELAEKDLKFRGPGEIMGLRQSGYVPFKIASLGNRKLIKLARGEAENFLEKEMDLTKFPLLKQKVDILAQDAHLE